MATTPAMCNDSRCTVSGCVDGGLRIAVRYIDSIPCCEIQINNELGTRQELGFVVMLDPMLWRDEETFDEKN